MPELMDGIWVKSAVAANEMKEGAFYREPYQWPGVRETVSIDQIKRGYYSLTQINPAGIIPKGPLRDFERPHERERLPGQGVALLAAPSDQGEGHQT